MFVMCHKKKRKMKVHALRGIIIHCSPIHCFPSEASSVGGMARKSKYITDKWLSGAEFLLLSLSCFPSGGAGLTSDLGDMGGTHYLQKTFDKVWFPLLHGEIINFKMHFISWFDDWVLVVVCVSLIQLLIFVKIFGSD